MKDKLIQYVDLLFAGAEGCEDIKQEILQNTLDRYDDLIDEGKSPEAAYRQAIAGIGDINDILGGEYKAPPVPPQPAPEPERRDTPTKKLLRAIAVALYIICIIPVIVLSEMDMDLYGLCGTLSIVAVATVLMILGAKKGGHQPDMDSDERETPQSELGKSISTLIWTVGVAMYFIISFLTNAWHLTWILFPLIAAVNGLVGVFVAMKLDPQPQYTNRFNPQLRKSISGIIWAVGLALYFIVSFTTFAWHITWVIFLIIPAVNGLVKAIWDLMEAQKYET